VNLLQQPTDASVQPDVRWSVEPEMILFVAAAVLTVIVAVVVGLLIRRALREERKRAQAELQSLQQERKP
jgi:flagellar biosynthesis/type III secretory pathway M-ring protein FliF/YscJ